SRIPLTSPPSAPRSCRRRPPPTRSPPRTLPATRSTTLSRSRHAGIAPGLSSTRVRITQGPARTLLKAHLAPTTQHPRALPDRLEALAVWEGAPGHAVLAV